MESQVERQQEVRRLLTELTDAKGTTEKVERAGKLLAELGFIPNTPAGITRWIHDFRQY